ncbi:hypothetical protein [Mesorhizobium sp. M1378]|uniref:hypothetical protein n=1 Tax=Mesorhizobium sp. M1378 TaxID=2957092 RepID=UPI00333579D8
MNVPVEFENIIAALEKRHEPLPSCCFQTGWMKTRVALRKDLDADQNAGTFADLVGWTLTTEAWVLSLRIRLSNAMV